MLRTAVALLACAAQGAHCLSTASPWDSTESNTPASRVAFASCHAEWLAPKEGGAFAWLQKYAPERFFWIGDSVYVNTTDLRELREAYANMTAFPQYARFVSQIGQANIDGTWDDHDYGQNDAGDDLQDKAERQQLFLDFLGKGSESHPNRSFENRAGTYSAHVIADPSGSGRRVGVIVLDTRMHRADHYVPAFSRYRYIPLKAHLSAGSRWLASFFGLYSEGDVLGDAQWDWLEGLLSWGHTLDACIVVSSIQVTTSNPFVESWGHFPEAKRRLMGRLEGLPSVVFVSGDVHFAEVSRLNELTSSGLSHHLGVGWRWWLPAALVK
eukprot:TRINITY_DN10242_c0_g1_i1.p1 TRINITY_DN10242_c0_g1~~TRINITY_DN10242_c0_g1_i1.p1  ORF type:complete len:326 (+),score=74.27 TRINITY_DN10242_c0_g1_i1:19-996(+)